MDKIKNSRLWAQIVNYGALRELEGAYAALGSGAYEFSVANAEEQAEIIVEHIEEHFSNESSTVFNQTVNVDHSEELAELRAKVDALRAQLNGAEAELNVLKVEESRKEVPVLKDPNTHFFHKDYLPETKGSVIRVYAVNLPYEDGPRVASGGVEYKHDGTPLCWGAINDTEGENELGDSWLYPADITDFTIVHNAGRNSTNKESK